MKRRKMEGTEERPFIVPDDEEIEEPETEESRGGDEGDDDALPSSDEGSEDDESDDNEEEDDEEGDEEEEEEAKESSAGSDVVAEVEQQHQGQKDDMGEGEEPDEADEEQEGEEVDEEEEERGLEGASLPLPPQQRHHGEFKSVPTFQMGGSAPAAGFGLQLPVVTSNPFASVQQAKPIGGFSSPQPSVFASTGARSAFASGPSTGAFATGGAPSAFSTGAPSVFAAKDQVGSAFGLTAAPQAPLAASPPRKALLAAVQAPPSMSPHTPQEVVLHTPKDQEPASRRESCSTTSAHPPQLQLSPVPATRRIIPAVKRPLLDPKEEFILLSRNGGQMTDEEHHRLVSPIGFRDFEGSVPLNDLTESVASMFERRLPTTEYDEDLAKLLHGRR